ncbi:MAG: hypothetical protein AB7R40_06070 [Nitrospiraceae bacterium]
MRGEAMSAPGLVSRPSVTVNIPPKRVASALACIVVSLGFMHLVINILHYRFGHDYLWGFLRQFHLNQESNIPTWYSVSTLLVAALLLALIGLTKYRLRDPYRAHWLWLAAIFLYLSADEGSRLHEMSEVLYPHSHYSGLFYYPWVIGGTVAVLVIGLSYIKFVLRLPAGIRGLVIVAGFLYVGGALGMEAVQAAFEEGHGYKNLSYDLLTGVEEVCEMAGIAVFIYALMRYAGSMPQTVALSFHPPETTHPRRRRSKGPSLMESGSSRTA